MRRLALLAVVALLVATGCQKPAPPASDHANVILVSIDSLRADHVSSYGYAKPTTPALDAFAASGVRFANSYATSPWTLPSHASMFTGLYPDAHLAYRNDSRLSDAVDTAAELFARAGFDTHAIVCAPFLRTVYNLHQGFGGFDEDIARTKRTDVRRIRTSEKVTDKAVAYLKKRRADGQPFFLFVHYWDPHYDYNPPKKYVQMFDPDYQGKIDGADISHREDLVPGMDQRDLAHIRALYDGEIRYTDDHLAKLLAYLDESGLAPRTAVIVTSDHGEEFLEHGSTGHTFTCFEELIRVPLAMRIPGLTPRAPVIETTVENVDLLPTMLSAAGLPPVKHAINGHDLVPLIRDGREPERDRFYCETRMGRRWGWGTPNGNWRSLLFADGRKVHTYKRPRDKKPEVNVYDIRSDPGEMLDLAAGEAGQEGVMPLHRALSDAHLANGKLARRLDLKYETWRRRSKKKTAEDKQLEDQLKGLGYVQ